MLGELTVVHAMGDGTDRDKQEEVDSHRLERLESRLDHLVALLESMLIRPPSLSRWPGLLLGAVPMAVAPLSISVANGPATPTSEGEKHGEAIRPASFPQARARTARDFIRRRRKREEHFPADLFADPGWDIMLDLYAAHYEGEAVSVSSLCIAASVPQTTALRWITMMTGQGWLIRVDDPRDRRRAYLKLSEDARARMDAYFDDLPH